MEAAPIGGSATQVTLFLVEIASQGLKRIWMMTNAMVISCRIRASVDALYSR